MKKIAFIFCICLIGVALVAPANSQPNTGTWDSRHGDFGAGTWTEKLWVMRSWLKAVAMYLKVLF
jgi:hypothetical protein